MKQITPKEANDRLNSDNFVVLDVREQFEIEAAAIPEFIHMPMQQIPAHLNELPRDKEIAVLCHSGSRSARVTQYLMQNGFDNVMNITGGIERWALEADASVPRYRKAFGHAQIINQ
jgi:rhodanese-related sulfurtransferase